ncbi:MAG: zinc ribbon domain-containing protein [Chloroflexi bacterium]|nr:zinc ribbon domain-containing protein [Chloroflexota bacterium]
MPIYEYGCLDCRKRTSVFVRSVSSPVTAACEHCGGKKLSRLMSKFAVHPAAVNFDDESSFADLDENDPRQMARLMRQMSEEAGEDMDPETGDMISRLEAGEDPEAVMADAEGGMGADDFGDDF